MKWVVSVDICLLGRGTVSSSRILVLHTSDKLLTTHFACLLWVQLCFLHTQIWPESCSTQVQLLSGQVLLPQSPPFQGLGSRLKQQGTAEGVLAGWGLELVC